MEYALLKDEIIFTDFEVTPDFRGTYIATALLMEVLDSVSKSLKARGTELKKVRFLYEALGVRGFVQSFVDQQILFGPLRDHGGYVFILDSHLIGAVQVSDIAEKLIPTLDH